MSDKAKLFLVKEHSTVLTVTTTRDSADEWLKDYCPNLHEDDPDYHKEPRPELTSATLARAVQAWARRDGKDPDKVTNAEWHRYDRQLTAQWKTDFLYPWTNRHCSSHTVEEIEEGEFIA